MPLKIDNETRDRIQASPLFVDLAENQFSKVLDGMAVIELEPGQHLFEQGMPAKAFFQLLEGSVKLTRLSPDGNEKVIDLIHPGQTFAEAVIFNGAPGYPVNAVSLSASHIVSIEAASYLDVLHKSPKACMDIMARISQRLHWLVNEVDRLTLHNATYRLVAYLLDQTPGASDETCDVCLSAPKHVIASRLSIKPETLSRTLKRLADAGLLEIQKDHVVLKEIGALKKLIQLESDAFPCTDKKNTVAAKIH